MEKRKTNAAKVLALLNHKGGVAKTTSAASIGLGLARAGKRTLLIDLDAQANLTSFLRRSAKDASIYEALTGKAALPIIQVAERLGLVPSSLRLAQFAGEVAGVRNRNGLLSLLLSKVAGDYDYIILDCPPSLGLETTNALAASDAAYIPLVPELLPLLGLETITQAIDAIREETGRLRLGGIFLTLYEARRKVHNEIEAAVAGKYGGALLSTRIRKNTALSEAPLYGGNIYEYAPGSNGARDYEALVKEILEREESAGK